MAGHLALFKTFVILYSNGTNRWTAPASYVSSCAIDVEKFPFDRQTCQLEFGSWTMDIKDFDIFPLDKPYKKHGRLMELVFQTKTFFILKPISSVANRHFSMYCFSQFKLK